MIYRFGDYELDCIKVELSRGDEIIHIEPQVFRLLVLLVENAHRLVTKDEIIDKVWDGRFISESGVASRIKSARKVLGDDGRAKKSSKPFMAWASGLSPMSRKLIRHPPCL